MKPKVNRDLLERFYQKTCTREEAHEVMLWLSMHHDASEVKDLMEERWLKSKDLSAPDSNLDDVYGRILAKIGDKSAEEKTLTPAIAEKGGYRAWPYYKIAASVTLILVSLFAVTWMFLNHRASIGTEIVAVTKSGERRSITLPDGSKVTLNAASELRYPSQFIGDNRAVVLTGEAYFEVVSNKEKPFIVEAEDVFTTALGTAFNVRSEELSGEVIVSLTEGSVRVNQEVNGNPDKGYVLHPGEQIEIDLNTREVKLGNFDHRQAIGWKEGHLIFENADVDELRLRLEKWYGVKIVFKNRPAKEWRFTGEYRNEELRNVLVGIQYSKEITYQINEGEVEITFKEEQQH